MMAQGVKVRLSDKPKLHTVGSVGGGFQEGIQILSGAGGYHNFLQKQGGSGGILHGNGANLRLVAGGRTDGVGAGFRGVDLIDLSLVYQVRAYLIIKQYVLDGQFISVFQGNRFLQPGVDQGAAFLYAVAAFIRNNHHHIHIAVAIQHRLGGKGNGGGGEILDAKNKVLGIHYIIRSNGQALLEGNGGGGGILDRQKNGLIFPAVAQGQRILTGSAQVDHRNIGNKADLI